MAYLKEQQIVRPLINCKAWGRIEDGSLTSSHGISAISVSGSGTATRLYTITMSPAMANDDYVVVTTGYAHEAGSVEGTLGLKTGTGGITPSTTQFMVEFKGNTGSACDCKGFAVFGS